MHNGYKRETIKAEFINLIKDYPNFPFNDRDRQVEVARQLLEQVYEHTSIYLAAHEQDQVLSEILDTVVFGLRQIQRLQDDPDIEEIMINGMHDIFIKKRFADKAERVPIEFQSQGEMWSVIEKLLEGTGRRVDRSRPLVDTRLADGTRVNIIVPPLTLAAPAMTIRKFPQKAITAQDLLSLGTLTAENYDILQKAVTEKKNILISGATASGKTTLLSALTSYIPGGDQGERIILIEETAEIKLPSNIHNKIHLEARPPNNEGRGEVAVRDLLKNALRMRPDRIIIGEVRSGEAFDLLQALNTGHRGSFTTLHANSAQDALSRLEGMVLMAGVRELPYSVIRSWIARCVDLVVHIERAPEGARRVTQISTVEEKKTNGRGLPEYSVKNIFTHE